MTALPKDFLGRLQHEGDCWTWVGVITGGIPFYPDKSIKGRKIRALRFAWLMLNGPPPFKHVIKRTCANSRCVNPAHAAAVLKNSWAFGRRRTRKPLCHHGHVRKESMGGKRLVCAECAKLHERRYRRIKQLDAVLGESPGARNRFDF